MRRIPPSLAISVGVHVLLAGAWWLVDVEPERRRGAAGGPAPIELVEPAMPDTVEVVMLDAETLAELTAPREPSAPEPAIAAVRAPAPPTARALSRPASQVVAREPRTTQESVATREPATGDPATREPSPLLDLRKGRDPEGRGRAALRTPDLERIALGPQAPRSVIETTHAGAIVDAKPRESIVSAEITPGGRGGYKIDDLVFKGRIEADGSVSINDKRNLQHQFTSWANIKRVLRTAGPLGLLRLDFDLTDAMMRRHKIDPYASRKLALLDQTRDARVEIGTEYRKQVLARTAQIVRQNLEVAWAAVTDPAARKQALFEMWDEVDETGDEELVAAGTAARAAIIGFIRARLPSGSAAAFTVAEIAELNSRRRSRSVFVPYG